MAQHRCRLEQLGAPRWSCGLGAILLALIIGTQVARISIAAWRNPFVPHWLLPLVWGLGALGVVLLVRMWLATTRPRAGSGPLGQDPPAPSNNRWRGP
jgi:hypothetical protein